ncbi:MAG: hypothetical protein KC613_13470 [Myxococcales bacterium]|nr:hypothetical protein [Myxococcales bacterium]MCB9524764.1 hypothetical protein [Myxococcales bacterium]
MTERWLALAVVASAAACASPNDTRTPPGDIWSVAPEQRDVQEPVDFRERGPGVAYGLPAPGQPGLADLIALLPDEGVDRDAPNLWADAELTFSTDQCQGGGPNVVDDLPMEVEVVVALHPRQYLKVPVCNQDERNYGSYVVVDDSGGIAVLRDARTEPFTFGDRLRMKVRALMQAFGDEGARYILVAEVEKLPVPLVDGQPDRPVLFERMGEADGPFQIADIGRVVRVEGYVITSPTNDNFNDLVISSQPIPEGGSRATADGVCLELCNGACGARCSTEDNAYCVDTVCPSLCQAEGARVTEDQLPVCWATSVDVELGRRGFSVERGAHIAITGPVVRGFQRQNQWVNRLGQIERLESED